MSEARLRPVERIVRPFQDFAHKQSSGGIVLIIVTAVALAWANSPWGASYAGLWGQKLTVGVGDFSLSKDLTHWINGGLMAIFFLVVGLEIKREVLVGELSSVRGAALPVVAWEESLSTGEKSAGRIEATSTTGTSVPSRHEKQPPTTGRWRSSPRW